MLRAPTLLEARRLAALEQIQPAEAVEDAELVLDARALKHTDGLAQHVDGVVDLFVLRVGDGNGDPRRRRAVLVLQQGDQVGGIALNVLVEGNVNLGILALVQRRDVEVAGEV